MSQDIVVMPLKKSEFCSCGCGTYSRYGVSVNGELFKQIVEAVQEKLGPIESFHASGEIAGPDSFHCGDEEYHLHYLDGVIPVYVPCEEEEEE